MDILSENMRLCERAPWVNPPIDVNKLWIRGIVSYAIKNNEIKAMEYIIKERGSILLNDSSFIEALNSGNVEIAELFIREGYSNFEINNMPMYYAIRKQSMKMVKFLIEKLKFPVYTAFNICLNCHANTGFTDLIHAGVIDNWWSKRYDTVKYEFCMRKYVQILLYLIRKGANYESRIDDIKVITTKIGFSGSLDIDEIISLMHVYVVIEEEVST
jgi:hypothetical protein